jgi:hypothetical protein
MAILPYAEELEFYNLVPQQNLWVKTGLA